MKICTVVGARPQFIKTAPLSAILRLRHSEILIHTGQHYDENMSNLFFEELGIPFPDYNLFIGSGGHGEQTGRMLEKIENILLKEKPDGVLVYGDTNSTLAGALAASKIHIPVFHVEAGLRSYNKLMPEEQNRVLTDHISTLLLCPTQTAVNNLQKEGIMEGVYFTGDIMYDAALRFSELAKQRYERSVLPREVASCARSEEFDLSAKHYYLATIHRAENTDNLDKLQGIFSAFGELDKPVVIPMHPRTRHFLGASIRALASNVIVMEPVGYLRMLHMTANAYMVLTDSGGLQKEAYFLKTPCTTLRDQTEWVETLDNEWNVLSPVDMSSIIRNATRPLNCLQHTQQNAFGDGHSAEKIVQRIEERLTV